VAGTIFSYANSEPEAWVGLFSALQVAGFFAVSCVSVHSENETDFKKRDVKSHVEDLMMELSIMPNTAPGQALERERLDSFMQAVVDLYIHVGNLPDDWQAKAIKMLVDSRRS
jgi:putative DNA methylase